LANAKRYPVGTRLKTPLGRFARIASYDREGFVHLAYYDEDGGEVCFNVRLLAACDIVTPPYGHVPRTTNQYGDPIESIVETRQFWASRTGLAPRRDAD
jgi:hypothetical protein